MPAMHVPEGCRHSCTGWFSGAAGDATQHVPCRQMPANDAHGHQPRHPRVTNLQQPPGRASQRAVLLSRKKKSGLSANLAFGRFQLVENSFGGYILLDLFELAVHLSPHADMRGNSRYEGSELRDLVLG